MGNRLSKIITRTGDDGTTSLADGSRIAKESPRIEAIGALDELNSLIGLLISQAHAPQSHGDAGADHWLQEVQHDLFDIGAELSVPGLTRVTQTRVEELERLVESLNAALPSLREFVLPGGSTTAAFCHLARTVCRRAERRCWALTRSGAQAPSGESAVPALNQASLRYLNRLSDLLFVQARVYARAGGGSEILWRNRRGDSTP